MLQNIRQFFNLLHSGGEEMAGMSVCRFEGGLALINFFGAGLARDAVVFDSGEGALLRRRQVWTQIIEIEIESDVAIEIAVARIARVAPFPAPDLPCGIRIASKRSQPARRNDRRKNGRAGARMRVKDAVSIENEP